MKNIKDPFKEALRKKMEEKPVHLETDAELWRRILKEVKPDPKTIYKTEYPWYAVAAGVLLFIAFGIGLFLYNSSTKDNTIISDHFKNKKEKAPVAGNLTEQEEIKIVNKTKEISKKESLVEKKSNSLNSNTPLTKYFNVGKVVHVDKKVLKHNLSDGSLVTLNKGAIIKIDKLFKDQRNLMLDGEAYFEVQADKNKPFTIYFSDYKLIVVGTKFNIRNMATEKEKEITVTEGVVRVFDNKNIEGIKVKKGEQLKLSPGTESVLKKVEANNYISWNSGNLDFNRSRLEEVAILLSRKFDQKIILANQIKNCKFTGDLSGLTLEEALKIISSSTTLRVEKSNRKLYITGSGCD